MAAAADGASVRDHGQPSGRATRVTHQRDRRAAIGRRLGRDLARLRKRRGSEQDYLGVRQLAESKRQRERARTDRGHADSGRLRPLAHELHDRRQLRARRLESPDTHVFIGLRGDHDGAVRAGFDAEAAWTHMPNRGSNTQYRRINGAAIKATITAPASAILGPAMRTTSANSVAAACHLYPFTTESPLARSPSHGEPQSSI